MKTCPKCKLNYVGVISTGKLKGIYNSYCTECTKKYSSERYKKNIKKIRKQVMNRLKKTNYAKEKTPEQKTIRMIKRKTRRKFPFNGVLCSECNQNKATDRHHTTTPIVFDKFKFLCHSCHCKVHGMNSYKEVKKT